MKKYLVTTLIIVLNIGLANAAPAIDVCGIVGQMGGIFRTLRSLAFVGAAFIMAGWAWGYISGGKAEFKDVKDKGTALIIGFSILFTIGIAMTLLKSGCENEFKNDWASNYINSGYYNS